MNARLRVPLLVALLIACSPALAQPSPQLQEIKISSQPALYSSLPFYIATVKGWWAEAGLKVTFIDFPAGAPQIAAAKSWDVGYTGAVPAVLGALRNDLQTIAIADDQSETTAMVVRGARLPATANPAQWLRDSTVRLTNNSTVDLVTRACMRKHGLGPKDLVLKGASQPEILKEMAGSTADVGALWAPNLYVAEESFGARVICSGKDAGVPVPGVLVARAEWARRNPQLVAKFLAVFLRAQHWALVNRKEALVMMKTYYEAGGVHISEASMKKEFDLRPTFGLSRQLELFSQAGGAFSNADLWMLSIWYFLRTVDVVKKEEAMVDPKAYVTDAYLRLVDRDPALKTLAEKTN